ncbi:Na(+)/H(+) antiporter subunit F1 [Bacillus sp. HMF5848]|uniref:Na(+)/H(+) antiporter subunit F1 n=1 Tax=Bacillus sp. HMF5848 TaxID=2495421 RepID=UPI000F7AC1EB|nr:Na(+)/H(+) antiporter subunit F1 [Bacillus sp. HMF5848]RSK28584.1 Na(+)/H(+) antiporter subunit F1 [Bacillus sp. HMF5848]
MLDILLNISLVIMSISTLLALYRVVKGPSIPDRMIALDTIGVYLMGLTAITSLKLNTDAFLEVIMLIGALAFIGTVALSKFIERGYIIEHNRD